MESVPLRTKDRKALAFDEEKEREWVGPFCFIQAADTQFGMIDSFVNKVDEVSVTWEAEINHTRTAIKAANQMSPKPRFFIVCGDLVDAMPGTMHRLAQEKDWNEIFQDLDNAIPLVCVCGNHDVGNTPTAQTIQDYTKAFGSDDYFTFWCGGVFNIVLNSQFFENGSQVPDLAKEHLAWIDEQLVQAKEKSATHVLIFQHIPFFLREANEEKEYFNLEKQFRHSMLDKFADAGVKAIFCGHYHRNAGGFYRSIEEVITTGVGVALGHNEPPGLRVVCVYQDRLNHKYYPLDQIPRNPELQESWKMNTANPKKLV
ncbi:serine/threonine-protein phosphatase CPPED1-like isoform X1 [Varroa jacobsoni]|uniref:serine/threonine-protein phosphatase CPPED1-like isoform X1 n=2 Tax=Varroa jacobsoni TaxID=62625 RepID=UPI000BF8F8D3|nr:serine/threonine-protein phosphatase CPPED1-like isoform X1 [Varroa jacobsoni]XP_022693958.1 serine/threonine-protein phosphatase CPPED1-like isoform X1 [Varroa jacobsoni]